MKNGNSLTSAVKLEVKVFDLRSHYQCSNGIAQNTISMFTNVQKDNEAM
jgi:hypothetical protein